MASRPSVGKMRPLSESEVKQIRKLLIRSPLLVADEDLTRRERMELWEDVKTKWNERNDTCAPCDLHPATAVLLSPAGLLPD